MRVNEVIDEQVVVSSSSVFLSATKRLDQWLSIKTEMTIAEGADPLLWHDVMVYAIAFQVK